MKTIDEKFIAKQKTVLLKEQKRLEQKIKELEKYPDYGRGDDDNAREFEDFETNLGIEAELKILLKKVKAALNSIDKGTYGKCQVCKSALQSGRLELMPYATVCIKCEKSQNKK